MNQGHKRAPFSVVANFISQANKAKPPGFIALLPLALAMALSFGFTDSANATVAGQCSIDEPLQDGNLDYLQCPRGKTNDYVRLLSQNGVGNFNGARLQPDILLSETPLFVHNICKYVDSRGLTDPIFIPFNTSQEWNSFIANHPDKVHLANCCVPRAMRVSDAPPPAEACTGDWVLIGLVDLNDNTKLIAEPEVLGDPTSELVLPNGQTETVNYPITDLPITRDDIGTIIPANSDEYVGKWECSVGRQAVSYHHSSSASSASAGAAVGELRYVHFRLQCREADWHPVTGCVASVATENRTCQEAGHPDGYDGVVRVLIEHICHGDDAVEVKETVISDTCVSNCKEEQVGDNFTEACPDGEDGVITKHKKRTCPSGNLVDEVVSNTCVCAPITDLGTEKRKCPDGQNGEIIVRKTKTCTPGDFGRQPVGHNSVPKNNGDDNKVCNCETKETVEKNTCKSCTAVVGREDDLMVYMQPIWNIDSKRLGPNNTVLLNMHLNSSGALVSATVLDNDTFTADSTITGFTQPENGGHVMFVNYLGTWDSGETSTLTYEGNGVFRLRRTLLPDGGDWAGFIDDTFTYTLSNGCSSVTVKVHFRVIIPESPLVLDLDGDGLQAIPIDQSHAHFDLDLDGKAEHVPWVGPRDAFLVYDMNGDGVINNRDEMFGNSPSFPNGFAKLASFDENQDGVIDVKDSIFSKLKLWLDANSDGVTQPGELISLADAKIASISVVPTPASFVINGQMVSHYAEFTFTNGKAHRIYDIWFDPSWHGKADSLPKFGPIEGYTK